MQSGTERCQVYQFDKRPVLSVHHFAKDIASILRVEDVDPGPELGDSEVLRSRENSANCISSDTFHVSFSHPPSLIVFSNSQ
jgi:hypothetical protein